MRTTVKTTTLTAALALLGGATLTGCGGPVVGKYSVCQTGGGAENCTYVIQYTNTETGERDEAKVGLETYRACSKGERYPDCAKG